ncbi:hypothetical protein HK101_009065 [Irineochytrium annulatum]|nr:hypothetical protein HK101_009065 [Irineochytrium annulatum]
MSTIATTLSSSKWSTVSTDSRNAISPLRRTATTTSHTSSTSSASLTHNTREDLQVRCARALAHLRAHRDTHPNSDAAALQLAKFVLDNQRLLPAQDRDELVTQALEDVHRLAAPRDPVTGRGGSAEAVLLLANLIVSRQSGEPAREHQDDGEMYADAFALYLRAADSGSAAAAHNAALLLEHGRVSLGGDASKSEECASSLHVRAAAGDHPGSLLRLYEDRVEQVERLWYRREKKREGKDKRRKADDDVKRAQRRELAVVVALDAVAILERAAENATACHPEALYVLACLVMGGDHRHHDDDAKKFNIGMLPKTSKHHKADPRRAISLLEKAARLGHLESRALLAEMGP